LKILAISKPDTGLTLRDLTAMVKQAFDQEINLDAKVYANVKFSLEAPAPVKDLEVRED